MRILRYVLGLALLACIASIGAAAQAPVPPPAQLKVGISVESERAAIQDILPQVRKTIADDYSKRDVQPVILLGPEKSLMAAARNAGCDYVVRVKILQLSQGGIDITHPGRSTEPSAMDPVAGAPPFVPGEIRIDYKVEPVNAGKVNIHDNYRIPPERYPLGPNFAGLQTVASQEARAAAATALAKLKKQKGL